MSVLVSIYLRGNTYLVNLMNCPTYLETPDLYLLFSFELFEKGKCQTVFVSGLAGGSGRDIIPKWLSLSMHEIDLLF